MTLNYPDRAYRHTRPRILVTDTEYCLLAATVARELLRDAKAHVTIYARELTPLILNLSKSFEHLQLRFGDPARVALCKDHVITSSNAHEWLLHKRVV